MLPCRVHSVISGFAPLVDKNKFRMKLNLPATDKNTEQLTEAADILILITVICVIFLPTTEQSVLFPAAALQWKI